MSLDTLVYADTIQKYAKKLFGVGLDKRTIAITSKAVLNVADKYKIKRSMPIGDILGLVKCIPPSQNATEFTLLVGNSYDYRFISAR